MAKKTESQPSNESRISIDDIGPIEHLEFDLLPGKVTVLTGYNGHGKSTALEAVDALVHDHLRLDSRDGTIGGVVLGLGVQIKVGRGGQNRRTGKVVVNTIEDKLSIADFVDPKIKDPVAADGKRLKSLVALAGFRAHPKTFESVCRTSEEFRALVKPESLTTTDPVEMANKVKKDLESQARSMETRVEQLNGEINSRTIAIGTIDYSAEHDQDVLRERVESAIRKHATLVENRRISSEKLEQRRQAEHQIELCRSQNLATPAEIQSTIDGLKVESEKVASLIESLRKQLADAESNAAQLKTKIESAVRELKISEGHQASMAGWQAILDSEAPIPVDASDVDNAKVAIESAQSAQEQGVLIRRALAEKENIAKLELTRQQSKERAEELRYMAQTVFDVLAVAVKELLPGIKLNNEQRIVVPHMVRGECFFNDLSEGERWSYAIDLAVEAFKMRDVPGILVISQPAWEGLDGVNRQKVIEKVGTTDLRVLTAQAERDIGEPDDIQVSVMEA